MDDKIIEFINELSKDYPLSQLIKVREGLKNDELYIEILELSLAHLVTLKK